MDIKPQMVHEYCSPLCLKTNATVTIVRKVLRTCVKVKMCVSVSNAVRLTEMGRSELEGRLEVYYNETWGTVCDDGFTDVEAKVACNGLGFGYV